MEGVVDDVGEFIEGRSMDNSSAIWLIIVIWVIIAVVAMLFFQRSGRRKDKPDK